MRSLTFLALIALTGTAAAQCPTRDALETGRTAYVTYPDGGTVGLRWLGARMVEETTRYPDGEREFRMISMGGVFITDEVDLDGVAELAETRITSRYPGWLYDRLPIGPEMDVTVTATNSFADGAPPEDEEVELHTGMQAEFEIAGCRYEAFPMLLTYHWADESFTSMMTHLPALGLSLELARIDAETGPLPFAPSRFSLTPP
ncbi:hypothetical protein [Tropicimonas sp. IMCC6043]|uniref:hypothetical protein n=1 Tax=Tropicimonas sp. IMCC6043 TaxID=2510645 RepID=UPI00101B732A|nr:hypothetical protein [Tropicimonas sp. IMCC6043]RYH10620.1 hypothetical protein EU800_07720 [Tropicimonas sp. IMCC6043]